MIKTKISYFIIQITFLFTVLSGVSIQSQSNKGPASNDHNKKVSFKDSGIQKYLQKQVEKQIGQPIKVLRVKHLKKIKKLDPINFEVSELKTIFKHCTNVRTLTLDPLISDVSFLSDMKKLERLDIGLRHPPGKAPWQEKRGGQPINSLEPIKKLPNLKHLDLTGRKIEDSDIPSDFLNNKKLVSLNMEGNRFQDLSFLKNQTQLESLSLSMNKISNISPLTNLKSLKNLDIANCDIKNITPLKQLSTLKSLQLNGNKIQDISPLSNLDNLVNLYLGRNQIKNISSLGKLKNLEWLVLEENNISSISSLKNLKKLVKLDLSKNSIKDVTPIKNLTNLKRLFLTENKIDYVPDFSNLKSLQVLNINRNPASESIKDSKWYKNLVKKVSK